MTKTDWNNPEKSRSMKQELTEGIALSQREPVGIPVLYGGEGVNERKKKTPVYSHDAGVGTGVPLFALYHFPDAENMVTHH